MSETIPTQTGVSTPAPAPAKSGNIPSPGSVGTEQLQNEAVTIAKIAAEAVTTAKLANEAVTTAKLGAQAVTGAKIANETINEEQLAFGSVTASKIVAKTITNAQIKAETVIEALLAKALIERWEAGAWTALETLVKVAEGGATQTLRVRVEPKASSLVARLRGSIKTTEKVPFGTVIAKIPAAMRPPGTVVLDVVLIVLAAVSAGFLEIKSTGEVKVSNATETELAAETTIFLDGISWNLT